MEFRDYNNPQKLVDETKEIKNLVVEKKPIVAKKVTRLGNFGQIKEHLAHELSENNKIQGRNHKGSKDAGNPTKTNEATAEALKEGYSQDIQNNKINQALGFSDIDFTPKKEHKDASSELASSPLIDYSKLPILTEIVEEYRDDHLPILTEVVGKDEYDSIPLLTEVVGEDKYDSIPLLTEVIEKDEKLSATISKTLTPSEKWLTEARTKFEIWGRAISARAKNAEVPPGLLDKIKGVYDKISPSDKFSLSGGMIVSHIASRIQNRKPAFATNGITRFLNGMGFFTSAHEKRNKEPGTKSSKITKFEQLRNTTLAGALSIIMAGFLPGLIRDHAATPAPEKLHKHFDEDDTQMSAPTKKSPVETTSKPLFPPDSHNEHRLSSLTVNNGEFPEVATVHKGGSVERSLFRQLMEKPIDFGFKGNAKDIQVLKKWAGDKAHIIATERGYVDIETGSETRVGTTGIDNVAYVLKKEANSSPMVVEQVKGTDGKFHIEDTNNAKQGTYEYNTIPK